MAEAIDECREYGITARVRVIGDAPVDTNNEDLTRHPDDYGEFYGKDVLGYWSAAFNMEGAIDLREDRGPKGRSPAGFVQPGENS